MALAAAAPHRPGHRVAAEQQPVPAGQLARLDDRAVGQRDLRAGGDVAARPRRRSRRRARCRCRRWRRAGSAAPIEMTSVPPPDSVPMIDAPPPMSEPSPTTTPARDAALDHRRAERAGVEVDEALVHDRRALGQVRAEPHAVGVGDAHAGRAARSRPSAGTCRRRTPVTVPARAQPRPGVSKPATAHGPALVHTTLVSSPKMPSRFALVRADQPVRRAGAGAGRRRGCRPAGGQVEDRSCGRDDLDAVRTRRGVPAPPSAAELVGQLGRRASSRRRSAAEARRGVPGVEHRPVGGRRWPGRRRRRRRGRRRSRRDATEPRRAGRAGRGAARLGA